MSKSKDSKIVSNGHHWKQRSLLKSEQTSVMLDQCNRLFWICDHTNGGCWQELQRIRDICTRNLIERNGRGLNNLQKLRRMLTKGKVQKLWNQNFLCGCLKKKKERGTKNCKNCQKFAKDESSFPQKSDLVDYKAFVYVTTKGHKCQKNCKNLKLYPNKLVMAEELKVQDHGTCKLFDQTLSNKLKLKKFHYINWSLNCENNHSEV